jgi:dsRNA-specific ribonuclease
VKVSLGTAGEATAQGKSKQEAETLAASVLLERLTQK